MARPRSKPFSVQHALLSLLMGLGVFIGFGTLYLLGFELLHAGRIYAGVSVGGINLSGLTRPAAAARITEQFTYPLSGKIILQGEGQSWLLSPAQAGLFFDPETTVQKAYAVGRSGGLFAALGSQFTAATCGMDLPPQVVFDQRMAYDFLKNVAAQVDRPMVEPSISIQGTGVVVTPGQVGRVVDIEASMALITLQMQKMQDGVVPLVMRDVNPVIVNIEEQAAIARAALGEPFILAMPDGQPDSRGPWVFEPSTLAGMLAFGVVQSGGQSLYQVTLDSSTLRGILVEMAPSLALDPQNTRFIFNDDTHLLEVIRPAIIGRSLDVEASIQAAQQALLSGEHTARLVFTFTPPAVTDDMTGEQLGIRELVHAETSYFYGSSPERVQNISAAASQFHGLLIAPGETFSMADGLGDISLDNGYAEAWIIVGDQTVKGVGGGVCQVSTTLFRAAFFSGFPIVERHAHAYRVGYYEKTAGNVRDNNLAGLDATVFAPLVDLKFTNDTPYWLLMETYVNPGYNSLVWKFYSTRDGRTVDWQTTGPTSIVEAPDPEYRENPDLPVGEVKQVDFEADGATISVDRWVHYPDGSTTHDIINTKYEPWQAVYEYGPGTEGMPPPPPDGGGE